MNCRPGDLAVHLGHVSENYGVFLRVLEYVADVDGWTFEDASRPILFFNGRSKVCTASSTAEARRYCCATVPDSILRPVRDNDGEDETLQWAPVPSSKEVV